MRAAGLVMAAALAGCSFGRFDSARNDTVVASFGNPTGGEGFGEVIATTTPTTGNGFLAAGARNPAAAARFEFTASGSRNVLKYSSDKDLKASGGQVGAIAGAPDGSLIFAIFDGGERKVVLANSAGEISNFQLAPLNVPGYGSGAALADVHRVTAPPVTTSDVDAVVLSYNEIFVYPEKEALAVVYRCTTGADAGDGAGSIVAGDLRTSNDGADKSPDEIIVGRPSKTKAGSVLMTSAMTLQTPEDISNSVTPGAACPVLLEIPAPNGEKSFGAKVAVGQFTGSADLDLAVSAPAEDVVYVFRGTPAGPAIANPIAIHAPAASTSFGAAIAAVDLDGDGHPELAIGEPAASVGAVTNAGRVHVYSFYDPAAHADRAMPVPAGEPLSDHSPTGAQQFGLSVAPLRFAPATGAPVDELVVGTHGEIFVYFSTLYGIDKVDRTR